MAHNQQLEVLLLLLELLEVLGLSYLLVVVLELSYFLVVVLGLSYFLVEVLHTVSQRSKRNRVVKISKILTQYQPLYLLMAAEVREGRSRT